MYKQPYFHPLAPRHSRTLCKSSCAAFEGVVAHILVSSVARRLLQILHSPATATASPATSAVRSPPPLRASTSASPAEPSTSPSPSTSVAVHKRAASAPLASGQLCSVCGCQSALSFDGAPRVRGRWSPSPSLSFFGGTKQKDRRSQFSRVRRVLLAAGSGEGRAALGPSAGLSGDRLRADMGGKYLDEAPEGTRVWAWWPAERRWFLGTIVQNFVVRFGYASSPMVAHS